MYSWRKMNVKTRQDVLRTRRLRCLPWHSPPHDKDEIGRCYLLTAACFEHRSIVGRSPARMTDFEETLLTTLDPNATRILAWAVLPNHYHVLVQSDELRSLLGDLGQMHGRLSYNWNMEECLRGRKVWYRCVDRRIRNRGHFWSTMNYIHHNPVRHGYTNHWQDWPYSSAQQFLDGITRDRAIELWERFPITGYGELWDPPVVDAGTGNAGAA
jgi:putative transposase